MKIIHKSEMSKKQIFLGVDKFFNVYRGILILRGVDCEVAIKLFKQEKGTSYEAMYKDVEVEASTIQEISDRLMNKDVTIKLIGIVEGKLLRRISQKYLKFQKELGCLL